MVAGGLAEPDSSPGNTLAGLGVARTELRYRYRNSSTLPGTSDAVLANRRSYRRPRNRLRCARSFAGVGNLNIDVGLNNLFPEKTLVHPR